MLAFRNQEEAFNKIKLYYFAEKLTKWALTFNILAQK
jgi:hypothetical protein